MSDTGAADTASSQVPPARGQRRVGHLPGLRE